MPDPDLRDQTDVTPAVKDCQDFVRSKLKPGAVEDKPAILEKCLYTVS